MIEILKSLFILINRKNIQKYLAGKFDLTVQELDQIRDYMEKMECIRIETNKEIRIQQLELKKVPVLKELALDEVVFLLQSDMDFDGILDVVYAKGGIAKGLGSIEWDEKNKCYSEKNDYKNNMVVFQFIYHAVMVILMLFIINKLTISMVWVMLLLILWMFFVTFPMFLLWENASRKKKLLKENFPFIFEPISK